MEVKELVKQAEKDYAEYVREQAKLSRDGKADPEFVSLMQSALAHEDRYWETLVKSKKKIVKKQRMRLLRRDNCYANVLTPLPATPKKRRSSEVEKDAQLFEKGADWLEQNRWAKGWHERIELPDGRVVEARCALGSILGAVEGLGDVEPNVTGNRTFERALHRVGLCPDDVIRYNDGPAESLQEVARYLRGLAYRIREGF